jgi:uncharacterized protein YkwD
MTGLPFTPTEIWLDHDRLMRSVNLARATQSPRRPLLVQSNKLLSAAYHHARRMADAGCLTHGDLGAGNFTARLARVGYQAASGRRGWFGWSRVLAEEVITAGQPDAAAAVQDWLTSPSHRGAILGAEFTEFGGGVAVGRDGQRYYCGIVATPGGEAGRGDGG